MALGCALGPLGRAPLGRGQVVLDQEGWLERAERRSHGQRPADDPAVGPNPLAGARVGSIAEPARAERLRPLRRSGRVAAAHIAKPPPAVGGAQHRAADPARLGQLAGLDPDQLDERVAQPDQPVEGAQRGVPSRAGGLQPEAGLELDRSRVRIGAGDDDVVDGVGHVSSL